MHFLALLSLVLVAPALASPVSPLAASADSQIARRQTSTTDACTTGCNTAQAQINACGTNSPACYCTPAIAKEMEDCASCKLEADPSQAINLQTMLTQYENGCQANNHTVGSLTLTGNGATAAIASATESMASAASTRSVAAASRSAAGASATAGSTKNGSGASVGGVRTGSALIAAGISVALVFL